MLNLTLKDLKVQWNAKPIISAADRARNKMLGKFGGYVRSTAKNSIKTGADNQHAPPGKPPVGHTGNPRYKDWIFYFVDYSSGEVVIGAILLPRKDNQTVPGTLERGGTSQVPVYRGWGRSRKITIQQAARPHMQPAFDKAVEKMLPQLIENSIVP